MKSWDLIADKFDMHMSCLAKNTRLQYWNSMKILIKAFNMPFESITSAEIERFKAQGVAAGRAPGSINRDLAVLKRIYNLCEEWGMPYRKPVIKMLRERQRTEFLDVEELRELINQCFDPELRLFIKIAAETGLRRENVAGLTLQQLDLKSGTGRVTVKGGKLHEFMLMKTTLREIESYVKRRGITGRIFPEGRWYERRFKRFFAERGYPDVVIHTLRHSYCSNLVMAGVDVRTIADLVGHASIATTNKYLHVNQKHKREAVDKFEAYSAI